MPPVMVSVNPPPVTVVVAPLTVMVWPDSDSCKTSVSTPVPPFRVLLPEPTTRVSVLVLVLTSTVTPAVTPLAQTWLMPAAAAWAPSVTVPPMKLPSRSRVWTLVTLVKAASPMAEMVPPVLLLSSVKLMELK